MKEIKILKHKGQPDVVKVNGGGRKPESDQLEIEPKPRPAKFKSIKLKPIRISPKFTKLFK